VANEEQEKKQLEQKVPHNVEVEQALLGAILVDNRAYYKVSDYIESSHFFEPLHGRIYDAMAKQIRSGQHADHRLIKNLLIDEPDIGNITVSQYVVRLALNATTITNAGAYGRNIYDLAILRKRIVIGESIASSAYIGDDATLKEQIAALSSQKSWTDISANGDLPADVICESSSIITDRKYLIKGILPRDGTSLMIGQSGAGKTFMSIAISVAIADGKDFFDRRAKTSGGVFVVAAEGGGSINDRIIAAKMHANISDDLPIAYKSKSCNLNDDTELSCLIKDLLAVDAYFKKRFGVGLLLVIIDTMSVAFPIEDENSSSQVAGICSRLQKISEETKTHVMGIHHMGKNQELGARGASAWRANVDVMLTCTADRDEITGVCTNRNISITKHRDGWEGQISGFDLEQIILRYDEDGDAVTSCAVTSCAVTPVTKDKPIREKSYNDRIMDNAFNEVCIISGIDMNIFGDGPIVRACPITEVRKEFIKRFVTGEENSEKRRAASRMAWHRVIKSHHYATELHNDVEMIWKISND
jgi:hypothetical protein